MSFLLEVHFPSMYVALLDMIFEHGASDTYMAAITLFFSFVFNLFYQT